MILLPAQINAHQKEVGAKTLNLLKLSELGFNVPPFIALTSSFIARHFEDEKKLKNIANEVHFILKSKKYAVRSSALIEDSSSESMAGQFHTEIDVSPQDLFKAIVEVLNQAKAKKVIKDFSLVIQEFIEADWAGVTFTRNPIEGREMIIETHDGRGEELVSGKIKPQRFAFYSSENLPSKLPLNKAQVQIFQKIETAFDFPQDIEWCLKEGELFLLQTRPITTLSPLQFEGIKSLEELLPQEIRYFFEKTEISEIAPRPKPFLMSLLQKIYHQEGPVAHVYRENSIEYKDTGFLKLLGNELYVDKEKELQSLLPSYSTLKNNYKPHFNRFWGGFRTFKNILSLAKLKGDKAKLYAQLKTALQTRDLNIEFSEVLDDFIKNYELIFKINLLAGTAIKKLETLLKKENISILDALSFPSNLFLEGEKFVDFEFNEKGLVGNSLNIDDHRPFSKVVGPSPSRDMSVWEVLPQWKKTYLTPFISDALFWQQLRERGRWLTVKKINEIKKILLNLAKNKAFKHPEHIYFLTQEELITHKLNEKIALQRKDAYEAFAHFTFPQKITDHFQKESFASSGLSPGIAEGILVDIHSLDSFKGKKILYTDSLLPELTEYFPKIEGILSKTGGLLSHLAIVAREKGLPVITNIDLTSQKFKIGDKIKIDASHSEIKFLD